MKKIFGLGVALVLAAGMPQAEAQDGGLVGGLLGAGAGAIIGGAATGKAGGAAAGAIIGGATGAIIGSAAERDRYRSRRQGFYYNARGRCYYEYPDGSVVRVQNRPC